MKEAASRKETAGGRAGRRGAEVRSDLFVSVELAGAGGLDLEVRSKVEGYYGDSIHELARRVLGDLGVKHARVAMEDQGALPFVIAARLETAVMRAGGGDGKRSPVEGAPASPPDPKERRRRSRLYLPGTEPRLFVNARLHEPDAVILDLEDSVHPGEKDSARILVRNALTALDFSPCERMVRINQLPLGLDDLKEIVPARPDLILIPKVETADQVMEVDGAVESIRGDGSDPIWLMPILESALGIENALDIARTSPRVAALTIGLEDYTADLGVVKTAQGEESLFARYRVVNAAKAAGVQAIDSVYGDVGDLDGLRAYGGRSRAMGFEGMGCVHPRQIRVIHEAFSPTEAELERAVRIVEAFEAAQAEGLGVVSLGSKMIDPPVVKRALRLVREARGTGKETT